VNLSSYVTLRVKLFVLIAGVIIFATSGVTAVALWRELIRGQELLAREGVAVASTAATAASEWIGPSGAAPGASDALGPVVQRLLESAPLDLAWAVDGAGRVVVCASRTGEPCPEGVPLTEFHPARLPLETLTRMIRPEGIVASAPIVRGSRVVGAVRVKFRHEEVIGAARDLAWGAAAVAGFWILLGHIFAAIFIRRVTQPLVHLVEAAESLAAEQGVRLEVPADPELAELVRAFNHMSDRLEERRAENQRLISELEARVAQKTRELLRADRLATLGGIAAGFAHEIGNSLNVIRGYASLIMRDMAPDSPSREDCDAVKREVTRAAGLIERFLVFARARTVHPHAQPLEPILRDAVEVTGPLAAQAGVSRQVEIDPDLPPVVADAELLRQAFLNLCVNAIQAMSSGGSLTVRARREDASLVAEFRDTGPGMDPETAGRVFEPFFTTKANGTGLGLAIVRQAAEAHGGSVELESEPGRGATFRVRLPVASPEKEPAAPAAQAR
jgi:signal transduction histidine kinase